MSQKEDFLQSCLVLDTETDSDNFRTAEIIESGFALYSGEWTYFQDFHRPSTEISPKIQSICYITNEMLADSTPFANSTKTFQKVVDRYREGYMVAHNSFFDQKVLERHGIDFSGIKWICTWRMAKKLFNGAESIAETNLPYLRFALNLPVPIELRCHRAGHDSLITGLLLQNLVDFMIESNIIDESLPIGPQVYEWVNQPIIYERMPFGKHKGELMTEVPVSYWQWAIKNTDWFNENADNHDPDLAASIYYAIDNQ